MDPQDIVRKRIWPLEHSLAREGADRPLNLLVVDALDAMRGRYLRAGASPTATRTRGHIRT
jgi:hypothetical protein